VVQEPLDRGEELGTEADNGKHDDPKTIYKCIKWFKSH